MSRFATATNAHTLSGVAAFVVEPQANLRFDGQMADGILGLAGPGEAGVPPH